MDRLQTRLYREKIHVGHEILLEHLVSYVDPVYPEQAQTQHLSGTVTLEVTVDKQGQVTSAKVLEGNPLLRQAAADAVKQWKYKPLLFYRQPVEMVSTVRVEFDPAIAAAATNKSKRLQLFSSEAAANCKSCRRPSYPRQMQGLPGTVFLKVQIDREGKVTNVVPVQGDKVFVDAARAAVSKWRYKPFLLNGQPLEVETTVKLEFGN